MIIILKMDELCKEEYIELIALNSKGEIMSKIKIREKTLSLIMEYKKYHKI
jgi:hypothetical protein